ncbi:hypothetical protein [Oleiharenicola lentus]|uniref:hypothetical protein n=1 Tax=Oleiharenicola lentus TaxID=2508720 RepID=UPI003F674CE9
MNQIAGFNADLSTRNSMYRSGGWIFTRRSGADSDVGRLFMLGLVVAEVLGSKKVIAALLEGAPFNGVDDQVSRTTASERGKVARRPKMSSKQGRG